MYTVKRIWKKNRKIWYEKYLSIPTILIICLNAYRNYSPWTWISTMMQKIRKTLEIIHKEVLEKFLPHKSILANSKLHYCSNGKTIYFPSSTLILARWKEWPGNIIQVKLGVTAFGGSPVAIRGLRSYSIQTATHLLNTAPALFIIFD